MRNNIAYRLGGAISFSDLALPIVLRGVIIENNRAIVGGAIYGSALQNVTISSSNGNPVIFGNASDPAFSESPYDPEGDAPTIIRNNLASVGGGIFYEPGDSLFFTLRVRSQILKVEKMCRLGMPCSLRIEQRR